MFNAWNVHEMRINRRHPAKHRKDSKHAVENTEETEHRRLEKALNGVGVDGVGVIFPFFYAFFPFFYTFFPLFLRIFPLFLRFSLLLLKGQGQTTAIYCKNGEFHSKRKIGGKGGFCQG